MTERIGRALPPPSGRAPVLNIGPRDVEGLGDELASYQQLFASGFARCEQRHWALKYSQGQMLDLERKSIEPMAVALGGGNTRSEAMQQFISRGTWSDDDVLAIHRGAVAETLGRPDGVLIIDGCDFPKQGQDSVGVGRQYCGPLGKLANCQASVVLAYASELGATLLDRRLYLPKAWFAEDHRERWEKCGIPDSVTFQTKPQLGPEMVAAVIAEGVVPFRWITMDESYGAAGYLLDQIHQENNLFFAEIPRDKQAWPRRPKVVPPAERGPMGRPPTLTHLAPDVPAAQRVDALALALRPADWQRFIIHEGSKGPLEVEIAVQRLVMTDEELPGRDEWLVLRRAMGRRWRTGNSTARMPRPTRR